MQREKDTVHTVYVAYPLENLYYATLTEVEIGGVME